MILVLTMTHRWFGQVQYAGMRRKDIVHSLEENFACQREALGFVQIEPTLQVIHSFVKELDKSAKVADSGQVVVYIHHGGLVQGVDEDQTDNGLYHAGVV